MSKQKSEISVALDPTRRGFIFGSAAAGASSLLPAESHAQNRRQHSRAEYVAQTELVRSFLQDYVGLRQSVIITKGTGRIAGYRNGQEVFNRHIMLGADIGDVTENGKSNTPAGAHHITRGELVRNRTPIFQLDGTAIYIHDLVAGREDAFARGVIQRSYGCLNADRETLQNLTHFWDFRPTSDINNFGNAVSRNMVYILPYEIPLTRLLFGIPRDYSPRSSIQTAPIPR